MLSEKNYYVFLVSAFLYFCVQVAAWGERKDKDEINIRIPYVLSQILFPFKKYTRIRMSLCVISGYIEVGIVIICCLFFLRRGDLNWRDINDIWYMMLLAVGLIAGTVDAIKSAVYEAKDRNMLYKLLIGLECMILLIGTIVWVWITISFLVDHFKR